MIAAVSVAAVATPRLRAADVGQKFTIEDKLPKSFGEWSMEPTQPNVVVDPRLAEMLENTYTQTVSRTYGNGRGTHIMLSLAYGEDQSRRTQLHKPETCYPAQGFALKFVRQSSLSTQFGQIKSTRLYAIQQDRHEPVTYWMRVGDRIVQSGLEQALERVRMGLMQGQIPDGLLFRVSTISSDPQESFALHDRFIRALLDTVDPDLRLMLIGRLSNPS